MLLILLMFLGVIALCVIFALIGVHIGAQMEAKSFGAGVTEENMRSFWTPNIVGGLLGVIPFFIFVVVIVVMAKTSAPSHEAAPAPAAPAAAH